MQKWEYFYVTFYTAGDHVTIYAKVNDKNMESKVVEGREMGISKILDEFGSDGWELVGVTPYYFQAYVYDDLIDGHLETNLYFKRPKE